MKPFVYLIAGMGLLSDALVAQEAPLTFGTRLRVYAENLQEERIINVYLPDEYTDSDTAAFPVIFVLDGGRDEDLPTVIGATYFHSRPWVDRIPPSIIVGIEGNRRRRDFTFAVSDTAFLAEEGFPASSFPQYGGSQAFLNFLADELQPLIASRFRTNGHRTVVGESLAGLLISEILVRRPGLFDTYIIISPSLWWGGRQLLTEAAGLAEAVGQTGIDGSSARKMVYLGVPQQAEDERMYRDAETIYRRLERRTDLTVIFDHLTEETHATVLFPALNNAFKKLASKHP